MKKFSLVKSVAILFSLAAQICACGSAKALSNDELQSFVTQSAIAPQTYAHHVAPLPFKMSAVTKAFLKKLEHGTHFDMQGNRKDPKKSAGGCAQRVREAASVAVKIEPTNEAKDYHHNLKKAGYKKLTGHTLLPADVAIVEPVLGHDKGHMTAFTGDTFKSDRLDGDDACPYASCGKITYYRSEVFAPVPDKDGLTKNIFDHSDYLTDTGNDTPSRFAALAYTKPIVRDYTTALFAEAAVLPLSDINQAEDSDPWQISAPMELAFNIPPLVVSANDQPSAQISLSCGAQRTAYIGAKARTTTSPEVNHPRALHRLQEQWSEARRAVLARNASPADSRAYTVAKKNLRLSLRKMYDSLEEAAQHDIKSAVSAALYLHNKFSDPETYASRTKAKEKKALLAFIESHANDLTFDNPLYKRTQNVLAKNQKPGPSKKAIALG